MFEPSPRPRATPKESRINKGKRIENHEKPHPRILVGREPTWAGFYGSSSLWSVHLLGELNQSWLEVTADHIEQTFPLQPNIALTPHRKIITGWEAHIGAFDISHPSRLKGKSWLFPQIAQTWWSEGYTEQLKRCFPREDIVFLLHRAEDVITSLKAGDEGLRTLKESLYWLMVGGRPLMFI